MTHAGLTLRISGVLLGLIGTALFDRRRSRRQDARIEDLECRIVGQRLDDVIRGGR